MRARLIGGVIAVVAVVAGGLIWLVINGIGDGPVADAASDAPLTLAQATPIPAVDTTGVFTEAEQAAINRMIGDYIANNAGFVREYLLQNPEILQEVVTELERRRIDQEATRQAEAIDLQRELIFESPRQAVLGNPDGDVTLVEFFDYNCTYCKRALNDMNALIAQDPNLRVVLKEFPVLGVGSTEAAQIAAAVALLAPDRYGEFHNLLLGSAAQATKDLALAAAAEIGLDVAEVETLSETPEAMAFIEESYMLADALGLTGTPSYILGDEVIVGAVGFEALTAMIASIRECGETTC